MGGKVKNPKEYYKQRRETHKEQIRKAARKYYDKVKGDPNYKEMAKQSSRVWRAKNPEKSRAIVHKYYHDHKTEILANGRRRNQQLKLEILSYYGNGISACNQCHESRIDCLSLDHINNDGYIHRKETGNGVRFYQWLKNHNLPEGYQTLCMNCQFIKRASFRKQS